MEKEDKIAFSILMIIIGAMILGVIWIIKVIGFALFGWFSDANVGIGFKDALIYSLIISFLLMVIFALVAGDGIVGELPSILLGFFLFLIFFTFTLAWLF